MKQLIFLILILVSSVFCCSAQKNNLEDSVFANIPVTEILTPITKKGLAAEKKWLEKERKRLGISKDEWESSAPQFPGIMFLDFELKTDYFQMPSGKIATFFTVHIENKELVFERINQVQTSKVAFFGRIISFDAKMKGTFEDEAIFLINETELNSVIPTDNQSYTKGVILPAGNYIVTVFLRDSLNFKTGIRIFRIQVPSP